ncbi:hypothetical protein C8R43DRAFT_1238322 [Mycena crocata]|nr:hypothetical protein C8R43DRAFT_1238322 [Mycena crocata]
MGRTHIKGKGAPLRKTAGLPPVKVSPMPPTPQNADGHLSAHSSRAPSVAPTPPAPPPPPARRIPAMRAAKQKAKPIVRTHSDMLKAVAASRKKEKAKRRAYAHPRKVKDGWVYVGNLSAHVTEEDLWNHFADCGQIVTVELRLTGALLPGSASADTAYVYGVVQFKSTGGARAATRLDGSILAPKDFADFPYAIVVEPELGDLPEVRKLNDRLLHKNCPPPPAARMADFHTASGVTVPMPRKLHPLMTEKTQIWKPSEEDKRQVKRAHGKRLVVDGFSFAMTVA